MIDIGHHAVMLVNVPTRQKMVLAFHGAGHHGDVGGIGIDEGGEFRHRLVAWIVAGPGAVDVAVGPRGEEIIARLAHGAVHGMDIGRVEEDAGEFVDALSGSDGAALAAAAPVSGNAERLPIRARRDKSMGQVSSTSRGDDLIRFARPLESRMRQRNILGGMAQGFVDRDLIVAGPARHACPKNLADLAFQMVLVHHALFDGMAATRPPGTGHGFENRR